jgi:hypothetical protein
MKCVVGGGDEPKYWDREACELTSMNWKSSYTSKKNVSPNIIWEHTHTHIHRKTRKKFFSQNIILETYTITKK